MHLFTAPFLNRVSNFDFLCPVNQYCYSRVNFEHAEMIFEKKKRLNLTLTPGE